MRILNFTTNDDVVSFSLMCLAIYNDRREHKRAELRKIGALQDVLESVSTTLTEDDATLKLSKGNMIVPLPTELVLEEDQFDMVRQAMDATAWTAQGARLVVKAYDFLDAAKHVTAKELAAQKGVALVDSDSTPV